MEVLFVLVCIIEIIMQIVSIVKLKKRKDSKYWNLFIGTNIASFISTVLAFIVFANKALGLGGAIYCLFISSFSFISNLILLIIGLIIKKVIKTNNVRLDRRWLSWGALVISLNAALLLVLPVITSSITLKFGEKKVVNYLKNKYGNVNYKVVNVYKEYSNYGMWDKYLSGYYYEMKSDYMEDTFIVGINEYFNYIEDDYFLPVYFSQKYNLKYNLKYNDWYTSIHYDFSEFNNYVEGMVKEQLLLETEKIDTRPIYCDYVKSWNNTDGVEYNPNYYIVSENNGRIPTIEELIDSFIKYNQ